jgi:hypothetical protein
MPSAKASLLISGHHAWPVSRYRVMSSFRVRTAQLRAYRRPPNCRRKHASCPRVQSSANMNACTVQPSGTSNLATSAPGSSLPPPRAPGRHRDAEPVRAPSLSHAAIIPPGYDTPPPPRPARQPGPKTLRLLLNKGALRDHYEAVSLALDHYLGNSSDP